MIKTKTNCFISRQAAFDYCKQSEPNPDLLKLIAEGKIRLGAPDLKKGERLSIDEDGRYIVVSEK